MYSDMYPGRIKVGGSKLEAGNRDGLNLLSGAVRVGQCCCDRLAAFSSKLVVEKAVRHQVEEGDQSGINICIRVGSTLGDQSSKQAIGTDLML